jgi:hypothetical protein
MALDVARDVGLADPTEIAGAVGTHLAQEQTDERQVADDGLRRQTAFSSQIIAELLEYLVLRGDLRPGRRLDHAGVAQHRQQPLQRRPGARLDGLLPRSLSQVSLGHALIEIGQLQAAFCDPAKKITDQAEAAPGTLASEPVFDETRRVEFNELSVRPTLQAPQQPAPAQVLLCNHHPVLRY